MFNRLLQWDGVPVVAGDAGEARLCFGLTNLLRCDAMRWCIFTKDRLSV